MVELVLTGHPDFWPKTVEDERKALYLGPWCFAGNAKYSFNEQRKFNLAKSPWATWDDVQKAQNYLESLIPRLIPTISSYLEQRCGTKRGIEYWRVIIYPWLLSWLQISYDRFLRLDFYKASLESRELKIKLPKALVYPIFDLNDLFHQFHSHTYNLFLFSEILNEMGIEINDRSSNNIQRDEFKDIHSNLYDGIKKHFFEMRSPVYFENVYGLNIIDEIFFYLKLGFKTTNKSLDTDLTIQNLESLSFEPENTFEKILKNIILQHIPKEFLEYKEYKTKKTLIIGSNYTSTDFLRKVAEIKINNGRWFATQHGGGYGNFKIFPIGKFEYEQSDGFITWGWKEHIYSGNFVSLPSPKLSKLKNHKPINNNILFVSTAHPPYYYRLQSCLRPEQHLNYICNSKIFFSKLDLSILKLLKYRPYYDYGHNTKDTMAEYISSDQVLSKGTLTILFSKCRLVVIDHMATSFLEAFCINVPTIIFWDPEMFKGNPLTESYLKRLSDVGVFHDNPESAAAMVNEKWGDIEKWWLSSEVQSAKDAFVSAFCKPSVNWKKEWFAFIKTNLRYDKV